MKRLYTDQNSLLVGNVKNILENNDIECVIKNFMLVGGLGELPPTACSTELWVIDDDKYDEAELILKKIFSKNKDKLTGWICANCGETVEGQFTECWNCGKSR